jgi:hypothetical protein
MYNKQLPTADKEWSSSFEGCARGIILHRAIGFFGMENEHEIWNFEC